MRINEFYKDFHHADKFNTKIQSIDIQTNKITQKIFYFLLQDSEDLKICCVASCL